MSNVDDLLREFRAAVPGPADGAEERILERARGAVVEPPPAEVRRAPRWPSALRRAAVPAEVRRAPRSPRWPSALRRAAVPVALAAAACLVIALAPSRDANDGGPTLLERAEAAIASPSRIVELSTIVRSVSNTGAINPHRTINMRQWTLAGAGSAMQFRILISEGPLDKPPTDEDSTTITDRTGRIIDQRSWQPLFVKARDNYDYPGGGGRGQLQIGLPGRRLAGPLTLVDQLREAYRSHKLKPVGRTAGGDLRFRLQAGDTSCTRWDYVLDAQTLLPRRMEITTTSKPCGSGGRLIEREVSTIDARSLPATSANRPLLAIGDWPTARTVQDVPKGASKPLDHVPPVPKLDER
jgi:hypothetical protein